MSGQTSVAIEQTQPVAEAKLSDDDIIETGKADPITSFLEEHGHKLIAGHDGETVTVAHAYYNCDPFRRLVDAMGEAALGAIAPQLHEENEEEITTEKESDDEIKEIEDKTDLKAEAKEPEKQSNIKQQKEVAPSKLEVPEVEQAQILEPQKNEVILTKGTSANSEVANNHQTAGRIAEPISPVSLTPPERTVAPMPSRNVQLVEAPTAIKFPLTTVATEARFRPANSAEINTQPIAPDNASELNKDTVFAIPVIEKSDAQPNEDPQIDERYHASNLEINDAEMKEAENQNSDRITFQIPIDENWRPLSEVVVHEVPEEPDVNNFILPIPETPTSSPPEYAEEKSDVLAKLNLPIEEVEKTVALVAQRIEGLEDEQAEDVHELLDQIAQKVNDANYLAESKFEDSEIGIKTEEVEEALNDLFIQLFNRLEVKYTPELVESFVTLALKGDLSEFILPNEEAGTNAPKDRGTHEVIKHLLAGIGKIKRSILYAYHLGKSAIHLYSQDFIPALEILVPAAPIQTRQMY